MNGRSIQATLLEGVPSAALDGLQKLLAGYEEPIDLNMAPWTPVDDEDWLAPALVQIDTLWETALFDAILGNIQEGRADEDIQDALIDALKRARRMRLTWFSIPGEVANPIFRLRAFLQPHRSILYTIPADVDDTTLRLAIETLGDAVAYSTNVEQELTHDGSLAGVFEVQMVYVDAAGMWMEAHFDDEFWDEDEEEDSEITY